MPQWAVTGARLGGRMHADLKSSLGPPPVRDVLEAVADAMAIEERGDIVRDDLLERIGQLRSVALPLRGGHPS